MKDLPLPVALIKTLQKNPWHFPLEIEVFRSLMPVACALTGDRIHWLMNLGTGLAGTQASFSCFSSGHLWAPFSLFIELEQNFFFFFFNIHIGDCYSMFALVPGPFSSVVLGSISRG